MICQLFRTVAAFRGEPAAPWPTWMRRHASACAACRDEAEALTRLERSLRRTAAAGRREPAPNLALRVSRAAIHARVAAASPPGRAPVLGLRWLLAGGVAVLLAALGGRLWFLPSAPAAPPSLVLLDGTRVREALAATDPGNLLAASQRLDDPLQRELDLLVADARQAARSLAVAFLPAEGP